MKLAPHTDKFISFWKKNGECYTCVWNLCHTSDRESVQCCSFGEEPDSKHLPVTVFSRCCSVWLLAFPKSQKLSSKVIILRLWRNVTQHNSSSCSDTQVLPALTEALEQVCIWRRVEILGWLRFYICSPYYITCLKAFGSFYVHCTLYPLSILVWARWRKKHIRWRTTSAYRIMGRGVHGKR
jgi:hypothetical protein